MRKDVGWLDARQWLGWNAYRCRRNITRTSWGIGPGRTRYVDTSCTRGDSFVAFKSWKDAYSWYTAVCEKNGAELRSFKTWCIQQGALIQILANGVWHGDAPVALCTFDSHRRLVSLREVMGWNRRLGFIIDHYYYARWLQVHVRDMMNVRVKHLLRRRYTIRFARTEPADCPVHGSIVTCDMSLECPGHVKIGWKGFTARSIFEPILPLELCDCPIRAQQTPKTTFTLYDFERETGRV